VITPVDYDHLEMLGPELSRIAWEKAGIIKAGRPAVRARQPPDAEAVIEAEARALGAPLGAMGRDFDAWEDRGRLTFQSADRLLDLPPPSLFGAHQFANAGLAVAALLALNDPRIDETAIAAGVAGATWPGRFQRLARGPLARIAGQADVWIDGAHNPHAGHALAAACDRLSGRDGRPVALIVGMLGRKDASGFFAAFRDRPVRIVTTAFQSPSATPAEALAEAARSQGLDARAADGVEAALGLVMDDAGPDPHVIICGSLHFIGDVLALDPETWPD
jgi:dihydrofolate synthase/folylpolyglutamate synthase